MSQANNEHLYTCVDLSLNSLLGETLKKGKQIISRKLHFTKLKINN
jgi:hypothetical protein